MRTKSMLQALSLLLCSMTMFAQSPSQPSPAVSAAPTPEPAKKDLSNNWMGAEVFAGYHAKQAAALESGKKMYPGGYSDGTIGNHWPTKTSLELVGADGKFIELPSHSGRGFLRATVNKQISWSGLALAGEKSPTVAPAGLKEIRVPVGHGVGYGEVYQADTILVRLVVSKSDSGVERLVLVPFTYREPMTAADGTAIMKANGRQLFLDPTRDERYYAADSPFGHGLHQTPKWHMEDIAGGFTGTVLTLEKPLEPGHYAIVDPASDFVWDFDVVAP